MGRGNVIGAFCEIGPHVVIGNNNNFMGHSSIGLPAEHVDYFLRFGRVQIGDNNVIREFVTINSSTTGVTKMGSGCIMLRGSHLSHDSVLEDQVTVSCNVMIGGESYVMCGANLGLGALIHQRQVIGSYSMLGMGTVVPKKKSIAPGLVFVGNPAQLLKKNTVGLKRFGVDEEKLNKELHRFIELRKVGHL